MATGTEPAVRSVEGRKKLVITVRAAGTGAAFNQIITLEITLNGLRNYLTKAAEFMHI